MIYGHDAQSVRDHELDRHGRLCAGCEEMFLPDELDDDHFCGECADEARDRQRDADLAERGDKCIKCEEIFLPNELSDSHLCGECESRIGRFD